jgi:hypothetical protein
MKSTPQQLEYYRKRYQANREKILLKQRAYWNSTKAERAKAAKAWREANPDEQRIRFAKNPGARIFDLIRCRAKAAGLSFDLDKEDIIRRVASGRCEMTGIKFIVGFGTKKNKNFYNPSIDRIDSNGGYTRDNVRVVLYGLNVMMNTWGAEKIHEVSDALREHAAKAS